MKYDAAGRQVETFDPRGADTGIEPPQGGGGGYSGGGGDPTTFTRCSEVGTPMPCDMQSRANEAFKRIEELIKKDNEKGKSTPSSGSGSSTIHESMHRPDGAKTTETDKPEGDTEKPGAVDPASVPCTDGVGKDGVITICTRAPRIGGGVDASSGSTVVDDLKNRNPCARMALRAQKVANEVIEWGKKNNKSWPEGMEMFDMSFTPYYIGQRWLGSNIKYFVDTEGGVPIGPGGVEGARLPREYGQEDFKDEFLDADATRYTPALSDQGQVLTDFKSDQVHHFVGGFSAGINGAYLTSAGQNARDFFENNPKDKALTTAAYDIGRDLARDPATNMPKIGETIRNTICR